LAEPYVALKHDWARARVARAGTPFASGSRRQGDPPALQSAMPHGDSDMSKADWQGRPPARGRLAREATGLGVTDCRLRGACGSTILRTARQASSHRLEAAHITVESRKGWT
jgi:hypothetical protein